MSDLLTPLMLVMDGDEVDTFWTFSGLMDSIVCVSFSLSLDYCTKLYGFIFQTHSFDMEKLMKVHFFLFQGIFEL